MEIQKAVWPERSCRDAVWGQYFAYACELPDLHQGPCVSLSVQDSVKRREAWEAAQKAAEAAETDESEATPA